MTCTVRPESLLSWNSLYQYLSECENFFSYRKTLVLRICENNLTLICIYYITRESTNVTSSSTNFPTFTIKAKVAGKETIKEILTRIVTPQRKKKGNLEEEIFMRRAFLFSFIKHQPSNRIENNVVYHEDES